MTGGYVALAAILLALGFGLYRRAVDGRVRTLAGQVPTGLDAGLLGVTLGDRATFVQFSAPVCAACRTTGRVLGELTDSVPGVAHVEIDAAERFDLTTGLGISRTPTVLLLDAAGRVHSRMVGAPTRPDVRRALDHLLDERRSA